VGQKKKKKKGGTRVNRKEKKGIEGTETRKGEKTTVEQVRKAEIVSKEKNMFSRGQTTTKGGEGIKRGKVNQGETPVKLQQAAERGVGIETRVPSREGFPRLAGRRKSQKGMETDV